MLNVGLIGVGRIGKLHAEHLAYRVPGARLAAIADADIAAAQACARRLGVPDAYGDYGKMLEREDIGAIVICTPTPTHAGLIVECAGAGKHIFCEKPIALDLQTIDNALATVKRAGVKLQIGFNRRFDANFRRVRDAVANAEIGSPHLLHIISRDPAPPSIDYVKVSGGIFLDMTIHDFDMARYLMGADVTEIYVCGGVLVDPAIGNAGDIDTALITLKFENGAMGTIDNSRRAVYGYDQRAEVFGSAGSISTGNNYPNTAIISTGENIRRDLPLNFFMDRYVDSFLAEMREFVDCVVNGKPVPVSGLDGRAPVAMALAAKQSLSENLPVEI
jgi:myo-inositol 2-dehydrogenase/D-chiro-inositol 1-dehydrogenase